MPDPAALLLPARVALETTLLLHGVPRSAAKQLAIQLGRIVCDNGANAEVIGLIRGRAIVGMNDAQLDELLAIPPDQVRKINTANLGLAMSRGWSAATTVSATMELAARAGISVFATGGLGGVHRLPTSDIRHPTSPLDISSDLAAFTRFPVAVVTSGVKSILDIAATRELLETLGIPVVGFQTDAFPAFYRRQADDAAVAPVDARIDDIGELARFVRSELSRTCRGVVVANPIPAEHEIARADWDKWLAAANSRAAAAGATGRAVTPAVLAALHEVSGGATLKANIALVESNAALAARLAAAMAR